MADQRADDDDRMSSSFRRKLSEGITGLLDPEGAFGKGRDYVSGFAQGTKSELVRIFASEVRSFLDNMDSVEMLQRVIAGLVIDVKAEIRFSVDKEGKLRAAVTRQDTKASAPEPAPPAPAAPAAPSPTKPRPASDPE
jgi:hypothetical protein